MNIVRRLKENQRRGLADIEAVVSEVRASHNGRTRRSLWRVNSRRSPRHAGFGSASRFVDLMAAARPAGGDAGTGGVGRAGDGRRNTISHAGLAGQVPR